MNMKQGTKVNLCVIYRYCLPIIALFICASYSFAQKPIKKPELPQKSTKTAKPEANLQNGTTTTHNSTSGTTNGHEWVDLGLSVKWATCNVGATEDIDFGTYYAWGETSKKSAYTEANSVTCGKEMGNTGGNLTYDAATANWGAPWKTPTKEQIEELIANCEWEWITIINRKCYKVTGPNGNSILLPAAGRAEDENILYANQIGQYWSSTPFEEYAYAFGFNSGDFGIHDGSRQNGRTVRPVMGGVSAASTVNHFPYDVMGKINGHEYVDLGLSVKWAICNVGGDSPFDYGNYYAWGEIRTKSEYTEENSVTYLKSMGNIEGNPEYDAARANWGSTWRLPTKNEIDELIDKCKWTWVTICGHRGYKVTGLNGNSIFLPAAGWRLGEVLNYVGEDGYYWSGTPFGDASDPPVASYFLVFDSTGFESNVRLRCNGRSIRPVSE